MGLLGTNMVESKLARLIQHHLADRLVVPFNIRLPNNSVYRFGNGDPAFTVSLKDQNALSAITTFDELRFTEAYINGNLDIDGDIWSVISCRELLRDVHPLHYLWRRIAPLLKGQLSTNKQAIANHYEYESDFYLMF